MPWVPRPTFGHLNGAQVTTQLLPQLAAALAVAQVRGAHHAEGQRGQGAAQELEEDIDETCLTVKPMGVVRLEESNR